MVLEGSWCAVLVGSMPAVKDACDRTRLYSVMSYIWLQCCSPFFYFVILPFTLQWDFLVDNGPLVYTVPSRESIHYQIRGRDQRELYHNSLLRRNGDPTLVFDPFAISCITSVR
jgi:hypothetical protein